MKKKILNSIFPILKIKNKKFKWHYKLYIYIETILMILMVLWLCLKPFYQIWFSHSCKYNNILLFSNKDFTENKVFKKTFDSISRTLKIHNIQLNNLEAKIFIADTSFQYLSSMIPGTQFRYLNSTEDAYTLNGSIYIKNIDQNISMLYGENIQKHTKYFENLLTHELVHIWQEDYYQSWIYLLLKPKWITEGYAVYVSESNNINNEKKEFLSWVHDVGVENIGGGDEYRLWGLMVKHAIEKMHKSVDELHLGKVEYDEVFKSLLKEYNMENKEK